MCAKLNIPYGQPAYYRSIYVWAPDERWGVMPTCGCCGHKALRAHAWMTHPGRKVITMDSFYYVMTKRYFCGHCEQRYRDAKNAAGAEVHARSYAAPFIPHLSPHTHTQEAEGEGEGDATIHYTFPGYARTSLPHLPNEYGLEFPAYLTHKHAVDLSLIYMMRSVFVKGVRPAAFSDMLLEWHARKYTLEYIRCEATLAVARKLDANVPAKKFSTFSDQAGYNGTVPSGKYLSDVYKKFMREIKPHLDREMKKRGAERLHWDASYKEAKHLSQYHGLSVFKVH